MGIEEKLSVWIVTTFWELADQPAIAVYDNAEAAEQNYEYMVRVFGDKRVHLDCLPILSIFKVQ